MSTWIRRFTLSAALVSLSLLPAALRADGEDAKKSAPPTRNRPTREETLKKYDKDGDGKLNAEERKGLIEDQRKLREAEMLKRFDKNGDGKLSDEERKAMQNAMKDRTKGKSAKGKGGGDGDDKKPDEKSKPN